MESVRRRQCTEGPRCRGVYATQVRRRQCTEGESAWESAVHGRAQCMAHAISLNGPPPQAIPSASMARRHCSIDGRQCMARRHCSLGGRQCTGGDSFAPRNPRTLYSSFPCWLPVQGITTDPRGVYADTQGHHNTQGASQHTGITQAGLTTPRGASQSDAGSQGYRVTEDPRCRGGICYASEEEGYRVTGGHRRVDAQGAWCHARIHAIT